MVGGPDITRRGLESLEVARLIDIRTVVAKMVYIESQTEDKCMKLTDPGVQLDMPNPAGAGCRPISQIMPAVLQRYGLSAGCSEPAKSVPAIVAGWEPLRSPADAICAVA